MSRPILLSNSPMSVSRRVHRGRIGATDTLADEWVAPFPAFPHCPRRPRPRGVANFVKEAALGVNLTSGQEEVAGRMACRRGACQVGLEGTHGAPASYADFIADTASSALGLQWRVTTKPTSEEGSHPLLSARGFPRPPGSTGKDDVTASRLSYSLPHHAYELPPATCFPRQVALFFSSRCHGPDCGSIE